MTRKIKSILFIFLMALAAGCYSQSMDAEQIYKKVNDAVVQIYAYDSYSKIMSQGSGVVLNDKGWIVTNYHVYNGCDKMVIRHNGKIIEYTGIVGLDADKDILIVKIADHTFPFIAMGNSDLLNVGQKIYAIGSPEGFENTISEGIVSGLRSYTERKKKYIQISAPISHGSSGGAVINAKGELIGISTLSVVDGQNINFAIPVNDVITVYKKEGVNQNDLITSDYFYHGNKALDENAYNKAILYYEKCLAIKPMAEVYNNLGICRAFLQQDGAIDAFNMAIQLNPNDAEAYLWRALIKNRMNDYEGALEDASKTIEHNPKNDETRIEAYIARGEAKGHLNQKMAMDDYNKAIEINPTRGVSYYCRGLYAIYLRDYNLGCLDLNKAAQLGYSASDEALKELKDICR